MLQLREIIAYHLGTIMRSLDGNVKLVLIIGTA